MADNVLFQDDNPATAPRDTLVAADEIEGVIYQRMKVVVGDDGINDGDVSSKNPLPIAIEGDAVQLLSGVLKELKKMNLNMAIITDNYIDNSEVE